MNLRSLFIGGKNNWKKRFLIRSVADLLELARKVNIAGENFNGWLVELECDIDLQDVKWQPIGNDIKHPFCGEFDGKGHVIRNLRLQTEASYVGLFGVICGYGTMGLCEIRNFCFDNFEIIGTGVPACTGSVAGYAGEGVLFENLKMKGVVRSWSFAGGVLGIADGSVGIRECSIEGTVAIENIDGLIQGTCFAGSIAGKMTSDSVLRNCNCMVKNNNGNNLQRQVGKFDDTLYIDTVFENKVSVLF